MIFSFRFFVRIDPKDADNYKQADDSAANFKTEQP